MRRPKRDASDRDLRVFARHHMLKTASLPVDIGEGAHISPRDPKGGVGAWVEAWVWVSYADNADPERTDEDMRKRIRTSNIMRDERFAEKQRLDAAMEGRPSRRDQKTVLEHLKEMKSGVADLQDDRRTKIVEVGDEDER